MKPDIKCLGLLITLLTFEVLGQKSCRNDCKVYTSCPKAVLLVNNRRDENASNKFKNAFCGRDQQQNFKVCCSDFDNINIDFRTEEGSAATKRDSVENHPNKILLPSECGDMGGARVVGGEIAAMYEFPWMALLSYRTRNGLEFQCGATIINSRYILTAAHCVVGKNIAGVRLGEYNIASKVDCTGKDELYFCENHLQDLAVESITAHENFTSSPATNDIALIRVDDKIDFGHKNIEAICLPVSSNLRKKRLPGATGVVTGWGVTELSEKSSVLRKVEVPIKNEKICRDYYMRNKNSQNVRKNIFCAGEIDKDSCNGDSGGPLQIEEIYDGVHRYVQYGIVSYGPIQCGSQFPGVYTDITKYMGWILDHIRQ